MLRDEIVKDLILSFSVIKKVCRNTNRLFVDFLIFRGRPAVEFLFKIAIPKSVGTLRQIYQKLLQQGWLSQQAEHFVEKKANISQ